MATKTRTPALKPVAELRAQLGLTRAQFSRLIGCSERALADWETEKQTPNQTAQRQLQQLRRIRDAAARVMRPSFVGDWLIQPNAALEGLKPVEVIERGEVDRLWRALFAAESGTPV